MTTTPLSQILIREPAEAYHAQAGKYLSSHLLATFRECPLTYQWMVSGRMPDRDRPAYLVGRALHALALEGREAYQAAYAVGGPLNPKTGKPYGADTNAFRDYAAGLGKDVLSNDQADLVEHMAASLKGHSFIRELLVTGYAERVVRCQHRGIPCQARFDWVSTLPHLAIIDLKTTDNLTWFEADARRFQYAHQMAFYRSVLAQALSVEVLAVAVHLIAVEKQPPYRCGLWRMGQECLAIAQAENEAAMERLLVCRQTGQWVTGYESVREFQSV